MTEYTCLFPPPLWAIAHLNDHVIHMGQFMLQEVLLVKSISLISLSWSAIKKKNTKKYIQYIHINFYTSGRTMPHHIIRSIHIFLFHKKKI